MRGLSADRQGNLDPEPGRDRTCTQGTKKKKPGQEEKGVEGVGLLLSEEVRAGPSSEVTSEQR